MRRSRLTMRLGVWVLPVLWGLLCGCAKEPNPEVTGKVTFKGQPLPNAVVFFHPQSGPASAGATQEDGTFKMITKQPGDGVLQGTCKVAITPIDPEKLPLPIPARYTDTETSGLTANVEDGENVFDFELTD